MSEKLSLTFRRSMGGDHVVSLFSRSDPGITYRILNIEGGGITLDDGILPGSTELQINERGKCSIKRD